MFFLLRTAFWLTLVLAVIPLGSGKGSSPVETVDPVSAFLAAQATVSDLGGFCGRNPQACETGGEALSAIGSSARDGAKIVYEFIGTQINDQQAGDPLVTGSTSSRPTALTQHVSAGPSPRQTAIESVSATGTDLGPLPRPKPRSGLGA